MQSPASANLRRLWDDLIGASTRWLRTILLATLVGKLAMTIMAMLLFELAGPSIDDGFTGIIGDLSPITLVDALVGAPLIESLGVVALVWILSGRLRLAAMSTALFIGLLAVPLHGLALASWCVLPLFSLFGVIQHQWRARGEAWSGFWIIAAIHFLANGVSVLAVALIPDA